MNTRRACIDCKQLTTTTRCPTCTRTFNARYRGDWRRTAQATITAQPWCDWCNTTDDLVADHLVPGRPEYGTRTLCRPCNTRRVSGGAGSVF